MTACTRDGAERIAGDREHERGVDAARQADHDALEAVLVHVVANAEHERVPDAFLPCRQRRQAVRRNVEARCPPGRCRGS